MRMYESPTPSATFCASRGDVAMYEHFDERRVRAPA